MSKVKARGRSESDTPRDAPQVPCNCGRKDECEEQKGTKREPKRLNDAVRSLDVAHPGAEGHRPIHKNNKPKPYHSGDLVWVDGEMKVCKGMTGGRVVLDFKKTPAGNNSPVTVSAKKIAKHYRNNYEWRLHA